MDFTLFWQCFVLHVKCKTQKHNQTKILPHKTGEKNVVPDLAISAQKYPKSVTQDDKKFQEIHNTVCQNYVVFTAFWSGVSHVYGHKKRP